eukprot:1148470-Pelagomonas_calceolata.AAC.4
MQAAAAQKRGTQERSRFMSSVDTPQRAQAWVVELSSTISTPYCDDNACNSESNKSRAAACHTSLLDISWNT